MSHSNLSLRQLMVLLFTALLSPAIQCLPGESAALAGRAAWLSPLLALPIALLVCMALYALLRAMPVGTGLAGAMQAVLGKPFGNCLIAVYFLFGGAALCINTKQYALRFLSTSYRNAPLVLFILVLLAMVLWMGRGELAAFVRAGEIFYLALSVALGLVLLFGLFQVEARHILPVWIEDLPAVLYGTVPVLGVLGYGIFGAFLAGEVKREEENRKKCLHWAVGLCGVLLALEIVCLGNFGPILTARMDAPFFMMVKGIGVQGAFERVESVIIALWVLSDLLLLGLLIFACRKMAAALGMKEDRKVVLPLILVAALGAIVLLPDEFTRSQQMESILRIGNLVLGVLLPLMLYGIGKLRKIIP